MFSCGFYNAIDHDRSYSAIQFGEMFDGLITDGVYSTIGECFMVVPGTALGVMVKSGRAWFNKTWSVNTADLPLDLGMADLLLPRIDAVILEVDTRVAVRNNSIKVVTGTPAVTPQRPSLATSDGLYQYPLAYINVAANASQITKSDITVVVGQTPCPFVTGILQSVPIDDMYQQWEGQFEEWFGNLKQILEGDVVGNLLYQLGNKVDKADKATEEDALAGTSDSKWMTPLSTAKVGVPVGGIIMWSGKAADIPSGWALCDGQNGTPDLRNRFVIAAGSTYSPGATGGSSSQSVAATVAPHTHGILTNVTFSNVTPTSSYSQYQYYSYDLNLSRDAFNSVASATRPRPAPTYKQNVGAYVYRTGPTAQAATRTDNVAPTAIETVGSNAAQTISTMPPYYALCFIMRIAS